MSHKQFDDLTISSFEGFQYRGLLIKIVFFEIDLAISEELTGIWAWGDDFFNDPKFPLHFLLYDSEKKLTSVGDGQRKRISQQ